MPAGTVVANSIAFELFTAPDSVAVPRQRNNSVKDRRCITRGTASHFWLSAVWLSVVKAVAHLGENFPRIQIVRAAKGEAVIQQHAAVCDVDALKVEREILAKVLAEG